ncbi:MAG: hypothetical protein SGARI_003024, partial [Bacillariaceae sp.]
MASPPTRGDEDPPDPLPFDFIFDNPETCVLIAPSGTSLDNDSNDSHDSHGNLPSYKKQAQPQGLCFSNGAKTSSCTWPGCENDRVVGETCFFHCMAKIHADEDSSQLAAKKDSAAASKKRVQTIAVSPPLAKKQRTDGPSTVTPSPPHLTVDSLDSPQLQGSHESSVSVLDVVDVIRHCLAARWKPIFHEILHDHHASVVRSHHNLTLQPYQGMSGHESTASGCMAISYDTVCRVLNHGTRILDDDSEGEVYELRCEDLMDSVLKRAAIALSHVREDPDDFVVVETMETMDWYNKAGLLPVLHHSFGGNITDRDNILPALDVMIEVEQESKVSAVLTALGHAISIHRIVGESFYVLDTLPVTDEHETCGSQLYRCDTKDELSKFLVSYHVKKLLVNKFDFGEAPAYQVEGMGSDLEGDARTFVLNIFTSTPGSLPDELDLVPCHANNTKTPKYKKGERVL